MRSLLLLRHAKSSWDDPSIEDFDRPLAARGERDAPRMGCALRKRGPSPDIVLSSSAVRARRTTEAFLAAMDLDVLPEFRESMYVAVAGDLLDIVQALPDRARVALLVGHNPGMEVLVERLSRRAERMPTCALARITFTCKHWADVKDHKGRFAWVLRPKDLGE